MKKKTCLAVGLSLVLTLGLLTGCGEKETVEPTPAVTTDDVANTDAPEETGSKTETAGAVTEAKTETAEPTVEKELTPEEQMIADSLVATGNNYRLRKAIEKAKAGEDVTLAFIGGSITEGYNAGTKEIFAKLVYEWFSENYGTGSNVHMVNAGLSGTPSLLGLIRSDRDIFYAEPDLVFIEFAVNDGSSAEDTIGFENLIRKSLMQPNEPAVFVLYSVTNTGYNAKANMGPIAFHYELPSVSVKEAIMPRIEAGTFSWDQWSNDETHPNTSGQLLYSKFIIHMMEEMLADEPDASYNVNLKSFKAKDYVDTKLVDTENNTEMITITATGDWEEKGDLKSFNHGWYLPADATNDEFTFTFTGKGCFIVYKDNNDKSAYAEADIFVDGEKKLTIDESSQDGWGNPVPAMIVNGKEAAEHTVTIKRAEGSEGKLAILGFGVCP